MAREIDLLGYWMPVLRQLKEFKEIQIVLSILTPVLAYAGLTAQDLTTWSKVGELIVGAVSNPYVLSLVAVSVWNTLNDPTTKGLGDSARAKSYTAPQ